jgi:hypothetical protein
MVYKDKTIGQIVFCTIILCQNFIPMMTFGQTTVHQNYFFLPIEFGVKTLDVGPFCQITFCQISFLCIVGGINKHFMHKGI